MLYNHWSTTLWLFLSMCKMQVARRKGNGWILSQQWWPQKRKWLMFRFLGSKEKCDVFNSNWFTTPLFVFPASLPADISPLPFFKNAFIKKFRPLCQCLSEISLCKVKQIMNSFLISMLKFEVYGDQDRIFILTSTVLYVKQFYQYITFFVKLLIYYAAAWISGC